MSEFTLDAAPRPIVIGLTGDSEIEQNIRFIVRTFGFDVRMDNEFAGVGSYMDSPLPLHAARRIAELTDAIEANEPRVKVISITYKPEADAAGEGTLYPVIRYAKREGA